MEKKARKKEWEKERYGKGKTRKESGKKRILPSEHSVIRFSPRATARQMQAEPRNEGMYNLSHPFLVNQS